MTFTVYSKQGCPYCVKVIRALQLAEQKYVELKLNRDFDKSEFIQQFGFGSTFPQIVTEDKRIGGCTETVKYLRENNLV